MEPIKIIIHEYGINWMHYDEIEIVDSEHARVIQSWRAHKSEDRGYTPPESLYGHISRNSKDIKGWMDDGRPGGIEGLRENYCRPSTVSIYYGGTNCGKDVVCYKLID